MILSHDERRASALAAAVLFSACAACSTPISSAATDGGLDSTAPTVDAPADDAASSDASPLPGVDAAASSDAAADALPADDAGGGDSGPTPFIGAIHVISDSTASPDGGMQVDYSAGAYFVDQ